MIAYRSYSASLRPGWFPYALIAFALGCFVAAPALAQDSWKGSTNNDWGTAGNWDSGLPTNLSTVNILDATNNPVTLNNETGNVGTLNVGASNSLDVDWNSTLNVYGGSISNAGTILVTAGNNGYSSRLNLVGNTTLSGGGTVTLGSSDGTGSAIIQQAVGGLTLTNADNTIQGYGVIGYDGLALVNQAAGIIDANVSGKTLLLNANTTNHGTLEATNNGILQISGVTVNDQGSSILANGGQVQILNATLDGGALTAINGGTFNQGVNNTSVTLGGATAAGTVTISAGTTWNNGWNSTTSINSGALVNNGAILVTAGNNGYSSRLNLVGNTTLSGGGTVTLGSSDGTGSAIIQQAVGGLTLTNADNTIQGYGVIGYDGLALVNQAAGIIDANVSGKTLLLNANTTNHGTLEATNNGILQISGVTVNDQGSAIVANGGQVQILNSTINGGALTASNGGTFNQGVNSTSVTLGGATSADTVTISAGTTWNNGWNSTTSINSGALINNGAILVTAGNNGYSSRLNLVGNTTLSGGGTVTLSTSDASAGQAIIQQAVGGLTLTNADNTIQGYGVIGYNGLALVNQAAGVIDANVAGRVLLLNANTTNHGTLEATNNGILQFSGVTVNDQGDSILADGGQVQILNSTINGGALTASNGGTFNQGIDNTSVTLGGATAADTVTISAGTTWNNGWNSTTSINSGALVNNGAILVTAGNNGYSSRLNLLESTTLSGGGTVTLSTSDASAGQAIIQQSTGGLTLTNADNTIQGYGVIGYNGLALVNQAAGVIDADASGLTLLLNANTTNHGTLEATNNGILQINGVSVSDHGSAILANGGQVQILNSIINGGALTASNGGTFNQGINNTSVTLGGATAADTVTISAGTTWNNGWNSTTNINSGALVNNGAIQVAAGGGGYNSRLNLLQSTTLSGGGTVTLGSSDGTGTAIIQQSTGGLTLTNGITIQGYGEIGYNGLAVVNNGTLLANSVGKTLLVDGGGGLTNNGVVQANAGSTLQVATNLNNFNAPSGNLTGGTYFANAGTIQLNLGNNTGGEITTNTANIVLSGPTATIVDSNGNNALGHLNTIAQGGSLSLLNGQHFTTGTPTAGFNFSNNGTLTVGADSIFSLEGSYIQGGTLIEDIAGSASGQFGFTDIAGTATLGAGSILNINFLNGFSVAPGDHASIVLLDALNGLGGSLFSSFNIACPTGDVCRLDYSNPNEVILDINGNSNTVPTPESGMLGMLLASMVSLAAGIKCRNRRSTPCN